MVVCLSQYFVTVNKKLNILCLGLAASLSYGAASELLRRTTSSADEHASSSLMMTEGNIKRLVSKLTQMRGAALKLGQFMSIQGIPLFSPTACFSSFKCHSLDSHVLPPEIEDIFRRVQDSAHYMPDWQMEVGHFLSIYKTYLYFS